MNLLKKHKQTHRLREQTFGCCRERWGKGTVRESGINMYTLLYLKWITSKVLLASTGNSAQCYGAAWMGGEFGGEWTHVYIWLSPLAIQLKLSQHCQSAIPQYKIKCFKKQRVVNKIEDCETEFMWPFSGKKFADSPV